MLWHYLQRNPHFGFHKLSRSLLTVTLIPPYLPQYLPVALAHSHFLDETPTSGKCRNAENTFTQKDYLLLDCGAEQKQVTDNNVCVFKLNKVHNFEIKIRDCKILIC